MQVQEIVQLLNAEGIQIDETSLQAFLKAKHIKLSEVTGENISVLIEHFRELSGAVTPVASAPLSQTPAPSVPAKNGSKRKGKGSNLAKVTAQPPVPVTQQERQQEQQEIKSGIGQTLARQAQEIDLLATMVEEGATQITEAGAYRIYNALANVTPNAAFNALEALEEGQLDGGFFCDGLSESIQNALGIVQGSPQGQAG